MHILLIILLLYSAPYLNAACGSPSTALYAYKSDVERDIELTMRIPALAPMRITKERLNLKKRLHSQFHLTGCSSNEYRFDYRGVIAKNSEMKTLALSPDEDLFALLITNKKEGEDRTWVKILIWDIETQKFYKRLDASVKTIEEPFKLAINRACTAIALSTQNPLFVWALARKSEKSFSHMVSPQRSPDAKDLMCTFEDAPHLLVRPPIFYEDDTIFCADQTTIRRLDLATKVCTAEYIYGGGLTDIDNHEKRLIATGEQGAKIWDVVSGDLLHTYPGYMVGTNIRFSTDGELVVVGTASDIHNYEVWQKVHEDDPRYKTIRHAFSCVDTPEAFSDMKAELLSCASDPEASAESRRDAYVALAIRCRAIADATTCTVQKKLYGALSEKYMHFSEDQ